MPSGGDPGIVQVASARYLFPVRDGYITVPDKPGLGIDPDPEIVTKYRV